MAQANFVPNAFCAAITVVKRNASTKLCKSKVVRHLISMAPPSPPRIRPLTK